MKKFIFVVLYFSISGIVFSQNILLINNAKEKHFLKFQFLQTNFQHDGYYFFSDTLKWLPKFKPQADTTTKMYVFKTIFIVDEKLKNTDLSVFVGATNYPCYVYLNKILIGRIGSYKELYSSQVHPYYEFILSPEILKYSLKDTNELQIQAYPKYNEVIGLDRIFISSFTNVSTYTFWRNFLGPKSTQVVTIFAFILFLYFITGHITKRDKTDRKYLFFALFSLSFAFSYINMVFSWNAVPQLTILKTARTSLSFSNLFLVFFTFGFTKILDKKLWIKILLFVPQIAVILLIWKQNNVEDVEKIVALFVNLLVPPYILLSFVLSIIYFLKVKNIRSLIFFIGMCLLLSSIVLDVINYSDKIIPYTWYIIFGYFSIIVCIFFILALEQTQIFHLSLDRAEQLEEMKTHLEDKVKIRTAELDKQKEELRSQAELLQETNNFLTLVNEELNNKNKEIEQKNEEINKQNKTLVNQRENIINSLLYASRIQNAVLPNPDTINTIFKDNFIFYKPKDIVSGDFYFLEKINNRIIVAVADCTGHGVPGAFMSMLGMTVLKEIVIDAKKSSGQILNQLRSEVKYALGQTGKLGEQQDGMDMSLTVIDCETKKLQFSGAYLPLWIFKNNGQIIEFKGDKMPIGVHPKDNNSFSTLDIDINNGDVIYLFTDGYYSQLGFEKNEKMLIKPLKQTLSEIYNFPMLQQKLVLEQQLSKWQGHKDQTDDILIIGLKL